MLDARATKKLVDELHEARTTLRRLQKTADLAAEKRREAKSTASTLAEIDRLERARIQTAQRVTQQAAYIADLEQRARNSWKD